MDLSKLPGKVPGVKRLQDAVGDFDVVEAADALDKAINAGGIELRRRRRSLRPTVVVTYRGWYADGVAYMVARCVEKPLFPTGEATASTGDAFRTNMRRFTILAMPGVTVRASMGEVSKEFTSDENGYLDLKLEVGELSPGWHVMDVDSVDGSVVGQASGRIMVTDPAGGIAVISDIDDTVLKTGLTQRWTALGRTFLRDVEDRKPVPGMSALYAALRRGVDRPRQAPFFYVSTGSWNFYDYLVAFLNLHGFPRGPLFLTDWGPRSDRLMRDGREHKRSSIRFILNANPTYDFVLVGDVGQGDPETYELMAREFPDRIKAIILTYVGSHLPERTAEVAARASQLRDEEGIPMYFVMDASEAATALWQLGLVDRSSITDVAIAESDRR